MSRRAELTDENIDVSGSAPGDVISLFHPSYFSDISLEISTWSMEPEAIASSTSSFVDDLGADSLDTVELVMALEEEFDLEIPDEDAEKIATVQDAVDYIKKAQTA